MDLASFISQNVFNQPELRSPLRVFAFSLPSYSFLIATSFTARAFRRIDYDVGVRFVLHPLGSLIAGPLRSAPVVKKGE